MNEKNCLQEFLADIDKIISGEPVSAAEGEQDNLEYQELLSLAKLLVKADYTPGKNQEQSCELADDDLDMVAGGLNLNGLLTEKDKKYGK
ncbi:MAG: hypothetical protein ACOWWO_03605 [Peptococcaceae bacterium]